jgi:hypothetical protein
MIISSPNRSHPTSSNVDFPVAWITGPATDPSQPDNHVASHSPDLTGLVLRLWPGPRVSTAAGEHASGWSRLRGTTRLLVGRVGRVGHAPNRLAQQLPTATTPPAATLAVTTPPARWPHLRAKLMCIWWGQSAVQCSAVWLWKIWNLAHSSHW